MNCRWHCLSCETPKETGKYFVGHRGTQGTAYFFAKKDIDSGRYINMTEGWYGLPDWGPTHWMEIPIFEDKKEI